MRVEHISGNLTDHYDPRTKTLRLSDATYNSTSVAALGVAAHECGHAVQHATGYVPSEVKKQSGTGSKFWKFYRMAVDHPWIFLQQQYNVSVVLSIRNSCIFACGVVPDCDVAGGI